MTRTADFNWKDVPEAAMAVSSPTSFTPTPEQQQALDFFRTGESLVIEAGAGTGKSATMKLFAEDAKTRGLHGLYVAFNKAIVDEAKAKFPGNMECRTAHSLAFQAIGNRYKHRLNGPRMRTGEIARALHIAPVTITVIGEDGEPKQKVLQPEFLAGHILRALSNFCHSADDETSTKHFPRLEGASDTTNTQLANALLPKLQQAWDDKLDDHGRLPFKHDDYLKAFGLTHPRMSYDFVLCDESQDLNPVIAGIVADQTCQVVLVGDSQQSIYSFTGAIDAIKKFRTNIPNHCYLSQSFRFGHAVAEAANVVLEELHAELRISGTPSIPSTVTFVDSPRAILARTNATGIGQLFALQAEGKRAHLVGGGDDVIAFAQAAMALQDGQSTQHPDLVCFDTWGDVQHYAKEEEGGEELRLLVKLCDDFTPQRIIDALRHQPDEHHADVIVSTAHKAKGRQWESVKLMGDFPAGRKDDSEQQGRPVTDEERRLLYVAVTRAQLRLDVTMVERFADWSPSAAAQQAAVTAAAVPGTADAVDNTEAAPVASAGRDEAIPPASAPTLIYRRAGDGEWVVFGPASAIHEGTTVTVTKRDGTTKHERIEWVGGSFNVNGVPHVYGHVERGRR